MNIESWILGVSHEHHSTNDSPDFPDFLIPHDKGIEPLMRRPGQHTKANRKHASSIIERVNFDNAAESVASEAHSLCYSARRSFTPLDSDRKYDKKLRHKTRLDKYDAKPGHVKVPEKRKTIKPPERDNLKKCRRIDNAATTDFRASNVVRERLTLLPPAGPGFLSKGKTSSGLSKDLPDLSYVEISDSSRFIRQIKTREKKDVDQREKSRLDYFRGLETTPIEKSDQTKPNELQHNRNDNNVRPSNTFVHDSTNMNDPPKQNRKSKTQDIRHSQERIQNNDRSHRTPNIPCESFKFRDPNDVSSEIKTQDDKSSNINARNMMEEQQKQAHPNSSNHPDTLEYNSVAQSQHTKPEIDSQKAGVRETLNSLRQIAQEFHQELNQIRHLRKRSNQSTYVQPHQIGINDMKNSDELREELILKDFWRRHKASIPVTWDVLLGKNAMI